MLKLYNNSNNHISLEILIIFFITTLIITYNPIFSEILSESGSADFHLTPSRCVFQGINHYESYLSNDGKCTIFLSQLGEYAQGFYILLFPFTLLDWNIAKIIWFILNIFLIFFIVFFICKRFKINKTHTYILIFAIYSSIIVKVHLIMGQQAIFVLFFLILPFVFKSKLFYFLSGVAYFKYSIGYALFIFYLSSKKYKFLIFSIMPSFLGWIIYCFLTNSNLLDNLFQPILLMFKNSGTINQFFLFSFMKFFFETNTLIYYFSIIIPSIFINILVINKINKLNNNLQKLTCLCILILISVPHYGHDYIIIIPLLIYAVYCYSLNKFLFRINLIAGIYFLNFFRATEIYLYKLLVYFKFNANFIEISVLIIPYLNVFLLTYVMILNLKKNKI